MLRPPPEFTTTIVLGFKATVLRIALSSLAGKLKLLSQPSLSLVPVLYITSVALAISSPDYVVASYHMAYANFKLFKFSNSIKYFKSFSNQSFYMPLVEEKVVKSAIKYRMKHVIAKSNDIYIKNNQDNFLAS